MKKKAVITGATGYIGSNLLRLLLSENWDITIISQPQFGYENIADIIDNITVFEYDSNIDSMIALFVEKEFDVVFHLAAAVITNPAPKDIPVLIQSNIQFGAEVLEAMKSSSTRLFINTGSYWQNYKSDSYNPVDLYAATKEAFEKIIQYYVDAHDYRVINLRLFDIYGENDKRPKLLNLLCKIATDGSSLDISPGGQYLDMVHISDVCSAYLNAYELLSKSKNIANQTYGVYTGDQIQLKDMINLFKEVLGKNINVNIGKKEYKQREVMRPNYPHEKLPNWSHKISLKDGLKRFNS